MKRKTIAAVVAVLLIGTGCSGGSKEVNPEPTLAYTEAPAPPTPTPSETKDEDTPAPQMATIDDNALMDLDTKGDEEKFQTAQKAARDYTVAQLSAPLLLSGAWREADGEDVVAAYGVKFSKPIRSLLTPDSLSDPENSMTAQSLGMFFSPTKNLTTVSTCTAKSTDLGDCIAGVLDISQAKVSYDKETDLYKFNITASAAQRLLHKGEEAEQKFVYRNTIWVDGESGVIVAIENSFQSSPITQ